MPEYYHSVCNEVFNLPLKPGSICPRCGERFAKIVEVRCQCSRTHVYITDKWYNIGDEVNCPITKYPVKVVGRSTKNLSKNLYGEASSPGQASESTTDFRIGSKSRRLLLYFLLGIIFVAIVDIFCLGASIIGLLIDFSFEVVFEVVNTLGDLIGSILTMFIDNLSLIGLIILGILGLLLLYNLIHGLSVGSVNEFSQDYPEAAARLNNLLNQPASQGTRPTSELADDYRTIQNALEASKHAVRRQQFTIGGIIIGATIGLLICYLSIKSVEEARQAIKKAALIGAPTILIVAVLFYSGVFFFKLPDKWSTLSAFRIGTFLSALLGIATVCTLVVVPPLLGEGSLSEPDIAIGLTINIIGDVLINLFENSIEKYWHTKAASSPFP